MRGRSKPGAKRELGGAAAGGSLSASRAVFVLQSRLLDHLRLLHYRPDTAYQKWFHYSWLFFYPLTFTQIGNNTQANVEANVNSNETPVINASSSNKTV